MRFRGCWWPGKTGKLSQEKGRGSPNFTKFPISCDLRGQNMPLNLQSFSFPDLIAYIRYSYLFKPFSN